MRLVEEASEFQSQLARARSEALGAFGNGDVLLERFVTHPRHIEVQVFGDGTRAPFPFVGVEFRIFMAICRFIVRIIEETLLLHGERHSNDFRYSLQLTTARANACKRLGTQLQI